MLTKNVALWVRFALRVLPVHTQSTQVEYGYADRRFLQEGNQLAQGASKGTAGKGPAHRQELHNNIHIVTILDAHLQVSVTAHTVGVLSVALWDILVTVITAALSLPTQTPNTLPYCSHFCSCGQIYQTKKKLSLYREYSDGSLTL